MLKVLQSANYRRWASRIKDRKGLAAINAGIRRVSLHETLVGDYRFLGDEVAELRFFSGPGYRVYVSIQNSELLLLLVGGDKSSQDRDILDAKKMLRDWKTSHGV